MKKQKTMKRIITILFLLIAIQSFSQTYRNTYIPWLKMEDAIINRYFIWHGDTLDFTQLDSAMFVRYSDAMIEYVTPEQLSDSLVIHQIIHDTTLTGEGTNASPLKVDTMLIPTFNDLLDYLKIADSTKYITQNRFLDTLENINNMIEKDVFEIRLPSSTTVAGRISGATEGVDYPLGWSMMAGTTPTDLIIGHFLGRRIAYVSVFAINGNDEQQLFNTAAYNGIISTDANTLKIQSLATIQKAIKIYIIFK